MRISIVTSLIIHIIVIGLAAAWSSGFRHWHRKIDVYQVELVSMPPVPKKITMEETDLKPVPIEKKIPEMTEKKPEIKTVKSAKKREERVEQEETKRQASRPSGDKEVKVDIQDFPFTYYLNLLRYRVRENWYPPYQESGEENKMSVVVGFRVERQGKITQINVETSSGKFMFDQAAVRAVSTAGPLPPLPDEYLNEMLTVHIEFEALW
jgi:TonB family protein